MTTPTTNLPPPVMYVQRPSRGLAIAAFTLGIVGSILGLIPILGMIAIPCGVLAFIFGLAGARKAHRESGGRGFARAGWMLGLVAITLGIVGIVIVDNAFDDLEEDLNELNIEQL